MSPSISIEFNAAFTQTVPNDNRTLARGFDSLAA